jgi:hypothetical protein
VLSRRKINQERCRVEGLLAVLDALVQRQVAASGGQQVEDADAINLFRLRHRASLHLLRLRLLAELPQDMLLEECMLTLDQELLHREQELRKNGLPLLHSKLVDAFVCSAQGTVSNGLRGAHGVIAELGEKLVQSREKWLAHKLGEGATFSVPVLDAEQLACEVELERALRVCLLYYVAQYSFGKQAQDEAAADHHKLVQQEEEVEKVCGAMGGTVEEATVARALFWLDAQDFVWHMPFASQLLCRPGVASVLRSLGLTSWCHRFLTLSARYQTPPETGSMELEACEALQVTSRVKPEATLTTLTKIYPKTDIGVKGRERMTTNFHSTSCCRAKTQAG